MSGTDNTIYDELGRTAWDWGVALMEDDKQDIGYTTYRGRRSHVYHGEVRPDHPSPFHHWQAAVLLCVTGQILGFVGTLQKMQQAMNEAEIQPLPQQVQQKQAVFGREPVKS